LVHAVTGRAITATLPVSAGGSVAYGLTPASAYQTIQAALDAASTDANDCTLILISPTATFYDIYTTGDPTWTGNYDIHGTHRIWAAIRNEHVSATSVMKFTGKVSLKNFAFFTVADEGGVIVTGNGWRIRQCGFNSTGIDSAATSVHIDGSTTLIRVGILEDVQFIGHVGRTTGIYIEQSTINEFRHIHMHTCLVGIGITDSDSSENSFEYIDIGDSALGLDIDAGDEQHFDNISFHHNTRNVDDEVGNHQWKNVEGNFAITSTPDDLTGVTVTAGVGNNVWSASNTSILAAGDNPFRVVGTIVDPVAAEMYRVRLFDGTTYFDDLWAEGGNPAAKTSSQAPSGTEFIFNKGVAISASAKSVTGGNNIQVSLKIQII